MKARHRVNIMASLDFKNKFYTALISVLLAVVFLLVIYILLSGKQQTVVIIPKGLNETIMVGQSEASEEYLLAMASYVTHLLLNFDANTVITQYDSLAGLSSSAARVEAIRLAEDHKKSGVSSRAVIQKIDVTDQKIVVKGHRVKYILDKPVEEKNFTLSMRYRIRFGTFRINSLEML